MTPARARFEQLEGRQAVREAMRAGRRIERLSVAAGARVQGALAEIVELAAETGVPVERVPRAVLDERAETRAHQGVIARVAARAAGSWRDAVHGARAAGRTPLLLALDGIQDPQNVGALLRTAEALGVDAVLLPGRRAASLGPGVAKASAGAVEHLAIDVVGNLESALRACKEEGLWVVALAGDGPTDVRECALLGEPAVVVVGAEGRGVSRIVRKRADDIIVIPMLGRVGSLNASAAGAIALWEASKRRSRG
ncbi:MAG TPA: 23S rRNA (guanosine(2251)-2'-O)-methyltransferase RlmB [Actinomycetota bacterium]